MADPVGQLPARYRVLFSEAAWKEDRDASSASARQHADDLRAQVEANGLDPDRLLLCDAEGMDGTALPDCLKIRVPHPSGNWGIVLKPSATDEGALVFIAFGVRDREGMPQCASPSPAGTASASSEPAQDAELVAWRPVQERERQGGRLTATRAVVPPQGGGVTRR